MKSCLKKTNHNKESLAKISWCSFFMKIYFLTGFSKRLYKITFPNKTRCLSVHLSIMLEWHWMNVSFQLCCSQLVKTNFWKSSYFYSIFLDQIPKRCHTDRSSLTSGRAWRHQELETKYSKDFNFDDWWRPDRSSWRQTAEKHYGSARCLR